MIHAFTRSHLLMSKLIMDATGDPCSHYAMIFPKVGVIFQSNLLGVILSFDTVFLNHAELVYAKEVPTTLEQEVAAIQEMKKKIGGKRYNFGALLYQAYSILMHKWFSRAMPTVNAWDNRSTLLCTEVYDASPDYLIPSFPHLDNMAMVRPYQLAIAMGASTPDMKQMGAQIDGYNTGTT